MTKTNNILTIAGSDILSGGGMQADLATFSKHGLYGMVALTSIVTIKNELFYVHKVDDEIFKSELESLANVSFSAIKIGLIASEQQLEQICKFLEQQSAPIILDPVLVFKENADYSVSDMADKLIEYLIPKAEIITPNLKEAEILTGLKIGNLEQMKLAAEKLYEFGPKSVVIKGGNRFDQTKAIDLFYDGKEFKILSKDVLDKNNDGAGCSFASAIASQLANGASQQTAVEEAKEFVYQAIAHATEYGVFQNY